MTTTSIKESPLSGTRASVMRPVSAEALRYLIASIAALGLDATLLALGSRLGAAPWLGGAVGYLGGLVLIYFLSIRWVFSERAIRSHREEFFIFAALGVFGLILNSVILTVAVAAGLGLAIAKCLSAGVGFVANFVTRKVILFTRAGQ